MAAGMVHATKGSPTPTHQALFVRPLRRHAQRLDAVGPQRAGGEGRRMDHIPQSGHQTMPPYMVHATQTMPHPAAGSGSGATLATLGGRTVADTS